jgi:predicted O-linked N-acetylglucosamine transferase (SPINDLY family)
MASPGPRRLLLSAPFQGSSGECRLNAVGLPELIAHSLAEYEVLALKPARNPALPASLKNKLACNRATCPLFDTQRFTRHIETAYVTM